MTLGRDGVSFLDARTPSPPRKTQRDVEDALKVVREAPRYSAKRIDEAIQRAIDAKRNREREAREAKSRLPPNEQPCARGRKPGGHSPPAPTSKNVFREPPVPAQEEALLAAWDFADALPKPVLVPVEEAPLPLVSSEFVEEVAEQIALSVVGRLPVPPRKPSRCARRRLGLELPDSRQLGFSVSPEEKEKIKRVAEASGMALASFLRCVVHHVVEGNFETLDRTFGAFVKAR